MVCVGEATCDDCCYSEDGPIAQPVRKNDFLWIQDLCRRNTRKRHEWIWQEAVKARQQEEGYLSSGWRQIHGFHGTITWYIIKSSTELICFSIITKITSYWILFVVFKCEEVVFAKLNYCCRGL